MGLRRQIGRLLPAALALLTTATLGTIERPAFAAPGSRPAFQAAAPDNLGCPGKPPPPLPGPGWREEPVWEWQDVEHFDGVFGDDGPYAVALDRACNSYVADAQNYQIVKFSPQGKRVAAWKLPGQRAAGASSSPGGV